MLYKKYNDDKKYNNTITTKYHKLINILFHNILNSVEEINIIELVMNIGNNNNNDNSDNDNEINDNIDDENNDKDLHRFTADEIQKLNDSCQTTMEKN